MRSNDMLGIGMTSQRTRDRLVATLTTQGIKMPAVLEAIKSVPRHLFVDEALASRAYENTALPIGFKQTISQPYVVACMVEALLQGREHISKVLEIGTGCGYQTSILALFAERIYTIERIYPLLAQTRRRLLKLEYTNIRTQHADGYMGWSQHAPFDGIIVSAASISVPTPLLEQLAVGGCLVIPVGNSDRQELLCLTRTETGYNKQKLSDVVFVPLLRGTG